MKNQFVILRVILAVFLFSMLYYCKKETLKVAPTVTSIEATNVTSNSATAGGTVTADGGDQVISRGVCWSSTNASPTTSDSKTSNGTGTGTFSSSISGLIQGTTYNITAYAINAVGTAYGRVTTFKTLAIAPVLTTTDISSVTATSLNCGGNITSDGGSPITARGVCWSTNSNPSITDNKTSDGTGVGIFASSVTGLIPGTTYAVRAYATNGIATSYGVQFFIKTLDGRPTITTSTISNITATTALGGGNITSDGGFAITDRGICWSNSTSPTLTDEKTSDGTGTGSFASLITGLSPGTKYFVRTYAKNSIGTTYGNELSFTTIDILPTISTSAVTSITETSVVCGGTLISSGGHLINSFGIELRLDTIAGNVISFSYHGTSLIGNFQDAFIDIDSFYNSSPPTFYARAFVTTSAGTGYGKYMVFTLKPKLPAVSDYEGNQYSATQIGTQVWLRENLKSTKFNDGTIISWYQDNTSWAASTAPAYCFINTTSSSTSKLYNYYTVNSGKLCPVGWHVPTDSDWSNLINFLGGNSIAGGKLKYPDVTGLNWTLPNVINLNGLTNFKALPYGERSVYYDMFDGWTVLSNSLYGSRGVWWSSTINPVGYTTNLGYHYGTAYTYSIDNTSGSISRGSLSPYKSGYSVRCIKN